MNRLPSKGKALDDFMLQAVTSVCKQAVATGIWTKKVARQWFTERFDGGSLAVEEIRLSDDVVLRERLVMAVDQYAFNEFLEEKFISLPDDVQWATKTTMILLGISKQFILWKMYRIFENDDMKCVYGVFASETSEEKMLGGVPCTMLASLVDLLVHNGVLIPVGEWSDEDPEQNA